MKILKRILLVFVVVIALSSIGGYFYFDKKFTPPENRLEVKGTSENIPFRWVATETNPISALLLPVKLNGISQQFFMQLDCGSPVTMLYSKPLESIRAKFPQQPAPANNNTEVSASFSIGSMEVSSERFQLMNYGQAIDWDNPDAKNIIGTIGTDLFEKRIAQLDFRNNVGAFVEEVPENDFTEFFFEKRRILFPAQIGEKSLKFLFDSGTSAYELITSKDEWEKYRTENGEIKKEKGNSWGNVLTILSAPAKATIGMGNNKLHLSEVTYIEGTSAMQNLLMKFSGMQGMIGCKLFLNRKLTLDCKNGKFKVD
jgi:hypothetical protein